MVQVLDGADAFDAFESFQCSPMVVLQPWMAMVHRSRTRQNFRLCVCSRSSTLRTGSVWVLSVCGLLGVLRGPQAIGFALDWLKPMAHSLQRACWHWQQAGEWLTKYGETTEGCAVSSVAGNAQAQDERMAQAGIHSASVCGAIVPGMASGHS